MRVRLITVDTSTITQLGYAAAVDGVAGIELAGQAGSAAAAVELVARHVPDVVLLDADLPDADGLTLGRRLRQERPKVGLVLLGPAEDDLLFRALEERLSAYLPRSASVAMVLSAVRHAAVAPLSFSAPDLADALARGRSRATTLSPREREILTHLHSSLTNAGIADALQLAESTVRTYVSRVYDKLGVNSREQALVAATRKGLLS